MSVLISKKRFAEEDIGVAVFESEGSFYYLRDQSRKQNSSNDTRRLNSELFGNIMYIFYKNWGEEHAGMHSLIFGDNLSAHKDIPTIKKMLKYSVFLWYLPENTSHFLQPLDSYPFATFKKLVSAIYEEIELAGALIGNFSPHALLRARHAAEHTAMAGNAIQKAFRACGIYPFSKTITGELIKENTGIIPRKTIEAKVRYAVTSVIQERKKSLGDRGKRNKKAEASVKKNNVYDPRNIAILGEKRAREKEEKEKEKKKKADERGEKRIKKAEEAEKKKSERKEKTCRGGEL